MSLTIPVRITHGERGCNTLLVVSINDEEKGVILPAQEVLVDLCSEEDVITLYARDMNKNEAPGYVAPETPETPETPES